MADKFLFHNAGAITEKEGLVQSAGAADAGKIPALDAGGRLDASVLPVGMGSESVVIPASEALSAGNFINIWDDAGAAKARKADASANGKEAVGFVAAAVANGASATVYMPTQMNNQLAGLTPGAVHYLSATVPGAATTVVPSGAGKVVQRLGRATSATEMVFNPGDIIVLA